jgi:hypothetical protein
VKSTRSIIGQGVFWTFSDAATNKFLCLLLHIIMRAEVSSHSNNQLLHLIAENFLAACWLAACRPKGIPFRVQTDTHTGA